MRTKPLPIAEFVPMLALIMSIVALATDIMLPALSEIGRELGVANENDSQLVISSLFLGFAVGQLVAGPLSDTVGRRPVIFIGYAIFIAGCVLSYVTTDFTTMLIGRALQGLGAAGPRIVSNALVRDGYEGRAMARIMSFIMGVFIIVPAIAPAIGQLVIILAGWRATFALLLVMALIAATWFGLRQPETLPVDKRRPFSVPVIASGIAEICRMRAVVGYTLAVGVIFGAFLGYLSSAQQIFQTTFGLGREFPLYFGAGALSFGAASFVNSMLVMRLGMRFLTVRALMVSGLVSVLLLIAHTLGATSIWPFMAWLVIIFFCMGLVFGNLNALAMDPLGKFAGLGAALTGSASTVIALPLGWAVGAGFDGTILSLLIGFCVASLIAGLLMRWADAEAPVR